VGVQLLLVILIFVNSQSSVMRGLVVVVLLVCLLGSVRSSLTQRRRLADDDDEQPDIPLPAAQSSPLWPKPAMVKLGPGNEFALEMAHNFVFEQVGPSSKSARLQRGFERYIQLYSNDNDGGASRAQGLKKCSVAVETVLPEAQERASLTLNADESFSIDISRDGNCKIAAGTIWGALYALETFTQLLERNEDSTITTTTMRYAPVLIRDNSRFTHRGYLMDSARFFLPLHSVRDTIDALAMSKMNVLHWHLSDAESFPFESTSAPLISRGAYTPKQAYSEKDLREMTEYAMDRGVRLLFEVDGPGHTMSWGKGYPGMMPTRCYQEMPQQCNQCYRDVAANPIADETFEVLAAVLGDIVASTDTQFLHLGGDEVDYDCWAMDEGITQFMSKHGISDYAQLLGSYVERAIKIANENGATALLWEDTFMAGVRPPKDTIFDVWTNSTNVALVTEAGYRVVAAPADFWYMDHTDNTWQKMYGYDPAAGLTAEQESLIVGGEVSMWGENFMNLGINEYNLIPRSWPQAAAVAERLWSPMNTTDPSDVNQLVLGDAVLRLSTHACRMNARGLAAAPLSVDDRQGHGFCAVDLV
jgi:hexosaminidase